MAAKPSGKVKTRTVKHTQKNGDIYILERQITYPASINSTSTRTVPLPCKTNLHEFIREKPWSRLLDRV